MVRSPSDQASIIFFGTPAFAVPTLLALIDSPHRVVAVVTQPDRPRGRGHALSAPPVKETALAHGIPVLQPERLREGDVADRLDAFRADLGVVAAFGKIFPERSLRSTRLGLINVHASLLPRYRGAAPVQRAIMAGETETGISIMRIVPELDAGPVFDRLPLAIGADDTSEAVERALATLGARLLLRVIPTLLDGSAREEAQDDDQACYAHRITRDDGLIDWTRSARAIHDQVRALHPWPHAYTYLDGTRYIILRTAVAPNDGGTPPGTVLDAPDGGILVAAGAQAVEIAELQLDGRRPTTAQAFLAGHRLPPTSRFESTRPR